MTISRSLLLIFLFVWQSGFSQENSPKSLELLKAIESNDIKLVKAALKTGADINFAIAVKSPTYDFFVNRNALGTIPGKLTNKEVVYITPMIAAAAAKNIEIVKLFFKKRANADAADSQGKTPLMYALRQAGGEEVALLLLKKGANYVVEDYAGNTALHYAAFGGNQEGIRMALGGGLQVNHKNKEGITPFMAASNHSDVKTLELLRSSEADPALTDTAGMNAVHFAAAGNKSDNIRYLVGEVLLKPNILSNDKFTAMDLAAIREAKEAVITLSQLGSNYYHFHFIELIEAVRAGKFLRVDSLLKQGVNPNRIDPESPLHMAAKQGEVGMSVLILKKITDPGMKDKSGKTAFQVSIEANQYKVASALFRDISDLQKGDVAMLTSRLISGNRPEDIESFHGLMAKAIQPGADVEGVYGDLGNAALHFAAFSADAFIFQKLIDLNANVNQANQNGWTPLHYLCLMLPGNSDEGTRKVLFEILAANGAELNAKTTKGFSVSLSTNKFFYCPSGSNAMDIVEMLENATPVLAAAFAGKGMKPELDSRGHTEAGVEYAKHNMSATAIREFDKAILLNNAYAGAWFQKGKFLQSEGKNKEAVKCFSEFIKLEPGKFIGFLERGTSRFESTDYAGAKDDFSQAIKLNPAEHIYLYYRGQAFLKLKQKDNACADFKAGKELGEAKCANSLSIHCK